MFQAPEALSWRLAGVRGLSVQGLWGLGVRGIKALGLQDFRGVWSFRDVGLGGGLQLFLGCGLWSQEVEVWSYNVEGCAPDPQTLNHPETPISLT